MAIDIEYENWRQAGDPLSRPANWSPTMPHANQASTPPPSQNFTPLPSGSQYQNNTPTFPAPSQSTGNQPMATLYNPATGARQAVPVGSQQAQALFGQGFKLETSAPDIAATLINPQTGEKVVSNTAAEAQKFFGQGFMLMGPDGKALGSLDPGRGDELNPSEAASKPISLTGRDSTISTFAGNIATNSLSAIQQALLQYEKQMQENLEKQRQEAESRVDSLTAGLEGAYNRESNEAALRRLNEEFQIKEKQAALTEIMNQMNTYQAAATQGLLNIENQPIALELQIGQSAALQRQAAATMTALGSKASVVQGQLNFARDMVSQYYSAVKDDRNLEISKYETLLSLANDRLIRLDKKEETAINNQREILMAANAREQAEKDAIIELMMNNPAAWAKSDVNLGMSYEEIATKLSKTMSEQVAPGDFQSVEVNGRLLTFDKNTGQYMDSGVTVPKQGGSSGGGGGGGGTTPGFTKSELKKLEAAGLLNATRDEQLDFLFGGEAKVLDNQLKALGFTTSEMREFKSAQEIRQASIDPKVFLNDIRNNRPIPKNQLSTEEISMINQLQNDISSLRLTREQAVSEFPEFAAYLR